MENKNLDLDYIMNDKSPVLAFKKIILSETKSLNIENPKKLYNKMITILFGLSFHHIISKKEAKKLSDIIEEKFKMVGKER